MSLLFSLDGWLRLPSRIALLLGLGALSAAGANPNAAEAHTGKEADGIPQRSATEFGDLRIWTEGGRIYLAEPGKPGEDLCLGDTLEARHLRQLLEQHGATEPSRHVPFGRILLGGGGGCGFDWPSPEKSRPASNPASSGLAGFGPAKPVNSRQPVPAETPAPRHNPVTGQANPKG
jgi:hypothetical protein